MSASTAWDHDDIAGSTAQPLLVVCVVFAVLETLFVIAFMFSWHYNKGNNSNNTKGVYILMLLGYIFCFAGVIIGLLKLTIGGAGHHQHSLSISRVRKMLKLVKAHEFIYVLSVPFPKLAILCLYLRLFTGKLAKFFMYLTCLIIIGTCAFGLVAAFSNCRPFDSFWNSSRPAQCTLDPLAAMRYYSVPNIVSDAALLLIPIPALFSLNGSTWRKVGVGLTFVISTLGIVTAVIRFVVFLDTNLFEDITYNSITSTNWSIIEPGVHLMGATVPTLRPLIRRMYSQLPKPSIMTTSRSRSTSQQFSPDSMFVPKFPILERPPLAKKSSARDMVPTIGRAPSRGVRLDDYHYIRYGSGVFSMRSDDEESIMCAEAVVHETMRRQGRNPDGSLQGWSLQPVQFSPIRTSFLLDKD